MPTIGSIGGVPVRVHWSWPLITLALFGLLAQVYALDRRIESPLAAALLATVLLSLSLLLHELAHALVARMLGMRVHGIAMLALGGVTEIADEHSSAERELAVAFAGPALNLALGLVFSLALRFQIGPPAVLLHLALANWALALFNLLPGYPLDGGRALKAVIWFLSGQELSASRIAAWTGRVCGWALVALGTAFALVTGDLLNAAWIGVVGLFLSSRAMHGYRRLLLQRALRDVTAGSLMRRTFRAVTPETRLDEFAGNYLLGAAERGFPVVPQPDAEAPQRLLGMMTVRDLRRYSLSSWAHVRVAQAMTPAQRVRSLAPDMCGTDALQVLLESGEDLLPVLEGELLVGVLWRSDVVGFIQRKIAP
ncbi:MAG: site-2 protease family protein [Chloroflexota bacterium]